ncbi:Uncharacterised protein [Mycobacteroides abscessus subsp. abscessus]|nr:Uncharacterised protein [Mycobacteroides abscessus subsp. abscessus]
MLVGTQQRDGQLAEQLGCAALHHPRRAGDGQIFALLPGLTGGKDSQGNVGIATDVS